MEHDNKPFCAVMFRRRFVGAVLLGPLSRLAQKPRNRTPKTIATSHTNAFVFFLAIGILPTVGDALRGTATT
jgi:hypothetical protein